MGHKMSVPIYTYIYINLYIPYHFEWLYIQSWQKKSKKSTTKNRKNKKKLKKIKNDRNNFWGPCQVLNRYISQQSILKQGFQKTHFPTVLEVEFFLLSIWLTSRRCAKLQIPISILTWFFRHLNMAFLGYFT